MKSLLDRADQVLAPTYLRPPTLFVRGDGSWLEDERGEPYLDMTSGIAVNALGHGSAVVREAMRTAADGLVHTSNLFHTAPAIELASELVEHSFADRVFFCNSGAEANEAAIKLARLCGGETRRRVVYFDGAFHGRTFGALAATDRPAIRHAFEPLPLGFARAAFDDDAALGAIDDHTAAVIVEPMQGEGGVRTPRPEWLATLRARCDATGALLIFDEVQCGLGRTGKLWAHEHAGVTPDLMTLAKPLAGGLPMGAVLMTERVAAHVTPGCHATTFGGGPFVASVALAVLREVCRPALLAEVERKGLRLADQLASLEPRGVRELRGRGLLVGVRVHQDAKALVAAAREERLLIVGTSDDVVRFLPALDTPDELLDEAVKRFAHALDRVAVVERNTPATAAAAGGAR
ncbi:MAG: acetylornithine transaminase [Myxococcales bacterium]|nr:acetylornithine transaminase [Myxococcales bacterium]